MPGQITCPHCGQLYSVTDEQAAAYAGQTINCTRCQKPFTVPVAPGMAAAGPLPPMSPASGAPDFPPPQQSNGLATASLVTGIIGCVTCIPVIPGAIAIILGTMGLRRTRDPRVGGRGLAIAGLVLGIVSLLLSSLAVATLIPALNRAREAAKRIQCASNLRQIGVGLVMYSQGNNGAFPPSLDLLVEDGNLVGSQVFVCPATDATPAPGATPQQMAAELAKPQHNSYVYVGMDQRINAPPATVVVYELPSNHSDGVNFLFADGHVELLSKAAAQKQIAELKVAAASSALASPSTRRSGP